MQQLPHQYTVSVEGAAHGDVHLSAPKLSHLLSASPAEFDGPGDCWSPETFLVGAVGDCLVLTFRAIAQASKLPWRSLHCDVTGTLDRIDQATQFTNFDVRAHLQLPAGTDPLRARRVLEKAEHACLITNSLKGAVRLVPEIKIEG